MKVLITGAAGMIGSNLAHWLIENTDALIIGVDDLSGGFKENLPHRLNNDRWKFFEADLNEMNMLDRIFHAYEPDIVYHAAAYAAENLSPFIRRYNYRNNVEGTAAVVNACINHNVKRLVFFSSIAVYGTGNPPFTEEQLPCPNDPYGVAKYACEMDIRIAGEQHGLDWCIVRPFNIYGQRQNIWDKYRNVLGIWMNQYLHLQPMVIFGDGNQVRNFTYVDDILLPLWKAGTLPEAKHQVINLGSSTTRTVLYANKVLKYVIGDDKAETVHQPPRHEVKTAVCNTAKAELLLGYKQVTELPEGLEKMWEWAQVQPLRPSKVFGNYEVNKGMYDSWKK